MTMTPSERSQRIRAIRDIHIETDRDLEVRRQLDRLLEADEAGQPTSRPVRFTGAFETRGISLTEGAGGGKTTVLKRLLASHPALQPRGGEPWPRYLTIQVPSPATLKSLGLEILRATGAQGISESKRVWAIWAMVRHRLALLDVTVLVIDEAHDLFLSRSAREIDDMLKMLKALILGDSAVIVILSGTERLSEITSYDPQVNRRFTKIMPAPLTPGVDDERLRDVIGAYCEAAKIEDGTDASVPGRLIHASRRRFGRAMETIVEAIEGVLGTTTPGARALLERGPRKGRPFLRGLRQKLDSGQEAWFVPEDAIDEFNRKFVKLSDLTAERQVPLATLKKTLNKMNLLPIGNRSTFGKVIYRRKSLPF